jgi:hypothetical protein
MVRGLGSGLGRASSAGRAPLAAILATSHGGGGDVQGRVRATSAARLPWTSSQHPWHPRASRGRRPDDLLEVRRAGGAK